MPALAPGLRAARRGALAVLPALLILAVLPGVALAEPYPAGGDQWAGDQWAGDQWAGDQWAGDQWAGDPAEVDWAELFGDEVRLGPHINEGGEGVVYGVATDPSLAIKVPHDPTYLQGLLDESASLDLLRGVGLPTVHHGVVDFEDVETGQLRHGLVMDLVPGLDVDDLLRLPAHQVAAAGVVNQRTLDDLRAIRETLEVEGVAVTDFQGRIAEDGAVSIIDTRAAPVGTDSPALGSSLADVQRYIDAAERVVAPPRETVDEDGASADEREGASDDGAGTLPGIGVTIAPDVPGVGDLDDLIDATFPGDPRGAGDLEPPGDPGGDLSDEAETLLGLPLPPPTLEDPLGDLLGDFAPVPELDALLYPNGPAGPRYTFPPAPEEGAPAVAADALRAEMQRWQRDLQAEGVIAHSAAEVFNNHQQELSSRFGLSAQQATEALGGSYSNRVGQRITGSAIVGPAIVGPKIVGPAIVGPGIVGEGIVGPCLDASCPNWGRINGFASAPSAPSAVTSGGSAPVWNPPAVRAPAGGSRVQPAPAAPAAPSAVRRPEHDTVAAPRPQPQPQQQPNWVQQAGQAAWDVLTYPHPLDPVRGAWRDAWRYLPGIGPAGQREFAH